MGYFSSRRKQCSSKNHSQEYRNYILKSESISSSPFTESCDSVISRRRDSSISNRYYYCSYCFGDQCNCYSDSIIIAYSYYVGTYATVYTLKISFYGLSRLIIVTRVLAISEW